jgi:hypothetical protein
METPSPGGGVSPRLQTLFRGFTEKVEPAEGGVFLDVTRASGVDAEAEARAVQAAVRAGTGLPCSVGAAPSKSLARLASGLRRGGVTVIPPEALDAMLDRASRDLRLLLLAAPQVNEPRAPYGVRRGRRRRMLESDHAG